jgi:hypothetical protein
MDHSSRIVAPSGVSTKRGDLQSVQKAPDGQLEASTQGSPSFGAGTHVPAVHVKPAAQSDGDAQLDLHVLASHANGAQFRGTSLHLPAPSQ